MLRCQEGLGAGQSVPGARTSKHQKGRKLRKHRGQLESPPGQARAGEENGGQWGQTAKSLSVRNQIYASGPLDKTYETNLEVVCLKEVTKVSPKEIGSCTQKTAAEILVPGSGEEETGRRAGQEQRGMWKKGSDKGCREI